KNESSPFKVVVNGWETSVLGTSFNIHAYENETYARATLLEGRISVKAGDKVVFLNPGQQAKVVAGSSIEGHPHDPGISIVENADVEQALAWKNGLFNFNGSDLKALM